jgi:pyruvate/2-oxoglutarate/acetoin dehydrogenase E1 component
MFYSFNDVSFTGGILIFKGTALDRLINFKTSCSALKSGLIWRTFFYLLDAPVMRCASLDTPIPFNIELENNFMAKARLGEYVQKLMMF